MSSPKIVIRECPYKSKYKENLMAVNPTNVKITTDDNPDGNVYLASEISQLIAKLVFDAKVYAELSKLFKISYNKSIEFFQIIILENLSKEDLICDENTNGTDSLSHYFQIENFTSIDFLSASSSRICGLDEFLTIPLKNLTVYGSELVGHSVKQLTPQILLSTPSEMFWDKNPIPVCNFTEKNGNYVFSQNYYSNPDNDPASLLAIDCEMVNTGDENDLELARISIVRCCHSSDLKSLKGIKQWLSLSKNLAYEIVYDEYVKPKGQIVDYLTKFSGITESALRNVITTLGDVHKKLKSIIKSNTILVGHSIHSDLKALKMYHPYVIDTSNIYNTSGDFRRKPGLKCLSKEMLKQEIRKNGKKIGHDSIEDAQTALKLVLLKLTKDITFGNKIRTLQPNPSNPSLDEWKRVSESSNKSQNPRDSNVNLNLNKVIANCVLLSEEIQGNLNNADSFKNQMKIDKFTLMKEHLAVVKTTDLLFKLEIALQIIVNTQGIIGRQQLDNPCQSVIKVLNDDEVAVEANKNIEKSDILISVLSDFSDINRSSAYDLQNKKLLSIRKNMKNIIKGTPEKSAIFVILPGTADGLESVGKFFWKIS